MKIDAHQHFWQFNANDFGWISDDMSILRRDFLPEELSEILTSQGIQGSVVVQARQSLEETHWLLSLAEQHPMVLGVVGWIDLCSDNLASQLEQFNGNTYLKGFRHVLQDEPDDNFMLQPAFIRGVKTLAEYGYSFDILIHARQLSQACKLVQKLPVMNLVIDHIAKPNIASKQWSGWQEHIEQLSQYDHVFCKVSGMVTEANWQQWTADDFKPYLNHVFKCFGSKRLMFGSDWPVCQVAATYTDVVDIVSNSMTNLDKSKMQDVFGDTASRFYRLA